MGADYGHFRNCNNGGMFGRSKRKQIIVGLPGNEVKGLQRTAQVIRNSGCYFPDLKVLINLASANLKKRRPRLICRWLEECLLQAVSSSASNTQGLSADWRIIAFRKYREIKGALPAAVKAIESGFKELSYPWKSFIYRPVHLTGF